MNFAKAHSFKCYYTRLNKKITLGLQVIRQYDLCICTNSNMDQAIFRFHTFDINFVQPRY